jgi:hypothetical protein
VFSDYVRGNVFETKSIVSQLAEALIFLLLAVPVKAQTVYDAILALPGGNAPERIAGSGTVHVTPGELLSPTANTGIWLMAPHDPNYAHPPAGWIRCNGCVLTIVGEGNYGSGPNTHMPSVQMGTARGPGIWLSGTQSPIHISNLGFVYPKRAVVIGECSNGDRTGTCGVSGVTLDNVTGQTRGQPDSGPCTLITGSSFWIWLRDYGCIGNGNATGGRFADNAAAILIDGKGNPGNGLIHISNSNLAGGGIKFIPGTNGGSLYADDVIEEGDYQHDIPPVVWFTAGALSEGVLSYIHMADAGHTPTPVIQNDGPAPGPIVISVSGKVEGPAVILNQDTTSFLNSRESPLLTKQTGFFNGYVVGETDVARRIAGLVPVRFKNLAKSNAASWTATQFGGTTALITGQPDPFGGPNATKATSTGGPADDMYLTGRCPAIDYTPAAGDWILGGAWIKGDASTPVYNLGFSTCGYPALRFSKDASQKGMMKGDGQWSWQWMAYKISGGQATHFGMRAQFGVGSPITVYGPVLYIIPAGTVSDNEALEFASTMASVDSSCPVGSICNAPGHPLVIK